VRRFGGFVAKYMGDGVLIYFGYPQAHEDDAERAVRAGLEAIAAVRALKFSVPLQARVAIATGLVVVGDLIGSGRHRSGIIGETPNLAAYSGRRKRGRPDGQITSTLLAHNLSTPSRKNIPLNPSGKSALRLRPSHPNEGRLAIVTDVAVRCGGREGHERRTWPARTAKSCGPGAPVLALSFAG
jgi:adenylate/guanylate cyclase family protein